MVFNRWIKPNCRGVWLSMLCSSTYSWARDLSHSCDNRYGITLPAIPGGLLCFQSVYPSSPRRIHPWYCRPRPSGTLRRRSEWAAQPWRLPCQPLCRASPTRFTDDVSASAGPSHTQLAPPPPLWPTSTIEPLQPAISTGCSTDCYQLSITGLRPSTQCSRKPGHTQPSFSSRMCRQSSIKFAL